MSYSENCKEFFKKYSWNTKIEDMQKYYSDIHSEPFIIKDTLKYTKFEDIEENNKRIKNIKMIDFNKISISIDFLKENYENEYTTKEFRLEIANYMLKFFPGAKLNLLIDEINKCKKDTTYDDCFKRNLKESLIRFHEIFKEYIILYNNDKISKLEKKLRNEKKEKDIKKNEEMKKQHEANLTKIEEIKKKIEETRKKIEEEARKLNEIKKNNIEIKIKHKFNFDEDNNKCVDLLANAKKSPNEILTHFLNKYPIYDHTKLDHYNDDILIRYYFKIDDENIIKTYPYELIKLYIERKHQFIDLFSEICHKCKIDKDICDIYTTQALKTLKLLYHYYIEIIISNIPNDPETISNMLFEYDEFKKLKEKIINNNGLNIIYGNIKQTIETNDNELTEKYRKILNDKLEIAFNYLKAQMNE